MKELIPQEIIERKIFLVRDKKVILDRDLAKLYGVKPIRLREQVKRNIKRFPEDFMFQLNEEEIDFMVSQNAIPSRKHLGGYRPFVFTEHGAIMVASILNTERAIEISVYVVRAFVKIKEILSTHKELAYKLAELERKIGKHDAEIQMIFEVIRQLITPPLIEEKPKRKIGFHAD